MSPIINLKNKLFISLDKITCVTFELVRDRNNKRKHSAKVYFTDSSNPLKLDYDKGGQELFNKMRRIAVRNK